MFLRFISLKRLSQFRITFQNSFIFILYNHLLHDITLCRTLYWKVWIFVFLSDNKWKFKDPMPWFFIGTFKVLQDFTPFINVVWFMGFLFQLGATRSLHILFGLVLFLCFLNRLCLHLQMIYLYVSCHICFWYTLSYLYGCKKWCIYIIWIF